jgi:hypothetical protein
VGARWVEISTSFATQPFYAYDLNYLDVVVAVADDPNHKPLIQRVARRSGHRTLRLIFKGSVAHPQRRLLLKSLDRDGVTWEGVSENLFSLDIPPEGDLHSDNAISVMPAPEVIDPASQGCSIAGATTVDQNSQLRG